MHIIELGILIGMVVILSNILDHFLVYLPISLIQIVLGLILAQVFHVTISVNTSWFMLLFVAPLLYIDALNYSHEQLWKLRWPIFANAIILVLITTVIGGWVIHSVIPGFAWGESFALAAICSPTDPVAVQSVGKQIKLPDKLLALVNGESLVNDVSGLIGFKFGIAATASGFFSPALALGDFVKMSGTGIIVGVVMITVFHWFKVLLLKSTYTDITIYSLTQIFIPWIIYFVAEDVMHSSGVLAVVTAGLLSSRSTKIESQLMAEFSIINKRTWQTIIYLINGAVFVILGITIPQALKGILNDPLFSTVDAVIISFVVWLLIMLIRAIWSYCYEAFEYYFHPQNHNHSKPSVKEAILSGLTGVRGAITLVGAMSVPVMLNNHLPFPDRALFIFIAASVVIISLLSAMIFIPLIMHKGTSIFTRGSNSDPIESTNEFDGDKLSGPQAWLYILKKEVRYLNDHRDNYDRKVIDDLIMEIQLLISNLQKRNISRNEIAPMLSDQLKLKEIAIKGELASLKKVKETHDLPDQWYGILEQEYLLELKQLDYILSGNGLNVISRIVFYWWHRFTYVRKKLKLLKMKNEPDNYQKIVETQKVLSKGAIDAISSKLKEPTYRNKFNRQVIYNTLLHYKLIINKTSKDHADNKSKRYLAQVAELRAKLANLERKTIYHLLEYQKITPSMANELRKRINYAENARYLDEELDN